MANLADEPPTLEEKRAAALLVSLTGLRNYYLTLGSRLNPTYVSRNNVDVAIRYLEASYSTLREGVTAGSRVCVQQCSAMTILSKAGFAVPRAGSSGVYDFQGAELRRVLPAATLREFLGNEGWIDLHLGLYFQYMRFQFSSATFEEAPLSTDRLVDVIIFRGEYRSTYAARFCQLATAVHQRAQVIQRVLNFVDKLTDDLEPNMRQIVVLVLRAYLREGVSERLVQFVGPWQEESEAKTTGRFGMIG
jgi:hypothetical protein